VARPAYERVGAAFRRAYETAGLRQSDIANALKVDPGTVSKWSRGLQKIELDYFPIIDSLCRLPRGTILRWAGYVEDEVDLRTAIMQAHELDDSGRRMLLSLYEELAWDDEARIMGMTRLPLATRERIVAELRALRPAEDPGGDAQTA
jgi:transcriptional regulator with XRE-family HTH domain